MCETYRGPSPRSFVYSALVIRTYIANLARGHESFSHDSIAELINEYPAGACSTLAAALDLALSVSRGGTFPQRDVRRCVDYYRMFVGALKEVSDLDTRDSAWVAGELTSYRAMLNQVNRNPAAHLSSCELDIAWRFVVFLAALQDMGEQTMYQDTI